MSSTSSAARASNRRWAPRLIIVSAGVGVGVALCALVIGLLLAGTGNHVHSGSATPGVDPRLIVRGHSQPVGGTLSGGLRLSGTLYPALPGANTVRLRVRGTARGQGGEPGRLQLTATMPGMAMRPVHATLVARGGRYQGVVALPMFGDYVARVVLVTPRGRRQGTMTLAVPLRFGR